jgi:hypothetical protein
VLPRRLENWSPVTLMLAVRTFAWRRSWHTSSDTIPRFWIWRPNVPPTRGDPRKVLLGFGMFYRLLIVQLPAQTSTAATITPPRVSAETRALLVAEIDEMGTEAFTVNAIAELQEGNPELLQMAHNFAANLENYLHVMQGFALLYRSLLMQSQAERATLH